MRVVHIIDSLTASGAEQSLAAMAPHLLGAGVDLHVAVLVERPGLRTTVERAGAEVHRLDGPGGRRGDLVRARDLVRALAADVVHTTLFESDLVGRWAGWRAGTHVVSSLVNEAYGPAQRRTPGIRRHRLVAAQLADVVSARAVDRFHAVSRTVAEVMGRRLLVPSARIEVIPRGRDPLVLGQPSAARRSATRQRLGLRDTDLVILGVGRHEHQKGLDLLIDTVGRVRSELGDVQLLVAGRDGSMSGDLRARAASLGSAVRLLGPRSDVADLLCASDVLAFPSRWEGMPGTLLEAMALGTPIVASDIPAVREVLPGPSHAELVQPGSASSLANGIVRVLADEPLRHRRTCASRARFLERYTVASVSRSMVDLYERVLA